MRWTGPVCGVAVMLTLAGCTGGTGASRDAGPTDRSGDPIERVTSHLLGRGARVAASTHPDRYWFPGSLVLPAGGPTCAVASITVGAHGPLVTDVVFEASGTVAVRVRAAPADLQRCVATARRMLRGFDATAPSDEGG